jgi:hypothetical protein
MPRHSPSKVAAALDYLERLKNQAAEFGGGVVENLADRARDVGGLAYEGLLHRLYANSPTPRIDQAAQDLGTISKAIVTQPIQTGKAIVQGEIDRAQEATTSPRAAGKYAGSFIDPMRIAAALRKTAPVLELDVYHGTPHRFPATEANPLGEFDASKIGTGEGAQAYGHGIYLSESPEVGRQYQQFLAARKNDLSDPGNMAASIMYRNPKGTREAGIAQIDRVFKAMKDYPKSYPDMEEQRAVLQKARELLESGAELPPQGGSFYKADLPDEMIDRMLDYDKPINEQSKVVLDALERAGINTQSTALAGPMAQTQEAHLAKYGIPGIYHRGQGGADVRTFVVFPGEEKKVRILERK